MLFYPSLYSRGIEYKRRIHQLNGVLTSYHRINQANNGFVREITPPSKSLIFANK